jgi:Glutaredoxin
MARIQMYTTRWCGYCVRAKTLLDSRGLEYGEPIGGYTELWQLDRSGELDKLAA